MEIIINTGSIADKRTLENATANNAALKANLDYVSMMADVAIPAEGVENNVVPEN